MKDRNGTASFGNIPLVDQSPEASPSSPQEIVEIELALAPIDDVEHLTPRVIGSYGTDKNQQDKQDGFYGSQHNSSLSLLLWVVDWAIVH